MSNHILLLEIPYLSFLHLTVGAITASEIPPMITHPSPQDLPLEHLSVMLLLAATIYAPIHSHVYESPSNKPTSPGGAVCDITSVCTPFPAIASLNAAASNVTTEQVALGNKVFITNVYNWTLSSLADASVSSALDVEVFVTSTSTSTSSTPTTFHPTNSTSTSTASSSSSPANHHNLPTSAVVEIAVGITLDGVALLITGVFFWRRSTAAKDAKMTAAEQAEQVGFYSPLETSANVAAAGNEKVGGRAYEKESIQPGSPPHT
ncbi:hypothetical protein ACMFMG_011388 [Clarireedia jacksonii]